MALPNYSGASGFYDPANTYPGSFGTLNVENQIPGLYQTWGTDVNPQGVFNARLGKMGLGGLGTRARTAQSMYGQSQQGYKAALTNNFELMYPEYLDSINIEDILDRQSFDQQGLDPQRFGQGPYRWAQRGY